MDNQIFFQGIVLKDLLKGDNLTDILTKDNDNYYVLDSYSDNLLRITSFDIRLDNNCVDIIDNTDNKTSVCGKTIDTYIIYKKVETEEQD